MEQVLDMVMRALGAIAEPFAGIHAGWALLALGCHLANITCRAMAWRGSLAAAYPDERLPVHQLLKAYVIGMSLNGYLPARGGEAVKVTMVRMQLPGTNVVTLASSSTVVLIFDAFVGVTLLAAAWMTGSLPAPPALPQMTHSMAAHPLLATMLVGAAAAAGWIAGRRYAAPARLVLQHAKLGLTVLRSPGRYIRTVVLVQIGGWVTRIAFIFCFLGAFGIEPSIGLATMVMVFAGMSNLVPVPGGVGSQQVLITYALASATTTATALSFSIGLQIGVTAINTMLGMLAAMIVFQHAHPLAALRAAAASVRSHPEPARAVV